LLLFKSNEDRGLEIIALAQFIACSQRSTFSFFGPGKISTGSLRN
jgi:hypothetical protein